MEVTIKPVHSSKVPMALLLLADPSEASIKSYIHTSECLVAEAKGEVVGVVVIAAKTFESLEIMNIAVSEAYQQMGIGKQLMLEAIELAKYKKARTIEIGTGNSSLSQLGFYQRLGFRIFDVWVDYFLEHYNEEIFENGIQCRDMIRLQLELKQTR